LFQILLKLYFNIINIVGPEVKKARAKCAGYSHKGTGPKNRAGSQYKKDQVLLDYYKVLEGISFAKSHFQRIVYV